MTDEAKGGQVVRVTTKRLDGGPPAEELWDVASPDRAAAEQIVSTHIQATDEKVEAIEPLTQSVIDGLGLAPNSCRKRPSALIP
jgi:hypothetical protein